MEKISDRISAVVGLLGIDFLFLVPLVIGLVVIAAAKRPAFAVLKRNFLAYFTNPTGYVFLCLFVALSSITAFWREGFFNSNLANLDQLNEYLPEILLVFIPAITMSIWAEERRLGTDELLLTIPATDFDIVLGKYLAAVAIFTVSLMFSQLCNFLVLTSLGDPDVGLFLANYFGYWMVGLAMLAIGMVASFMTTNLTVGFILGIVFCSPLVIASWANIVFPDELARRIAQFGIEQKFWDFQSGVISSASVIYFSMIVLTMLYLAMVLIGRRHWRGGRDGPSMGGHFAVRVIALIVITASVGVAAAAVPLFRWDVTSARLGSLLPESLQLIEKVRESDEPYVMKIEAFISKELPEEFVQRRTDLRSALQEVKAIGGDRVKVRIYDEIDIFGEQANRAETTYGIRRATTNTTVRGAEVSRDVIFGLAITYGLQRVVIPFMGETLPVEYELMRSLAIVTEKKRKTLGVLATDARWMGQNGPVDAGSQPLIAELKKQYEVKPVDASEPVTEKFDVLLAIQPSSLSPDGMNHFIDAVKGGQPTVIFEDPLPVTTRGLTPGTDQPRQAPRQMFPMMRQQQPEKGDIGNLWKLLGIQLFTAPPPKSDPFRRPSSPRRETAIIYQEYSPHPDETFPDQFVWITPECSEQGEPMNRDEQATEDLQKLLVPFPGAILNVGKEPGRQFTKLITTGTRSGWIRFSDCIASMFGQRIQDVDEFEEFTGKQYTLAATIHIDGKKGDSATEDINVAVVADMDLMDAVFFMIRERGSLYGEQGLRWQLDNVPFVLNIIDTIAGEDRFIKIRSRRPQHRELTAIKRLTDEAKSQRNQSRKDTEKKFKQIIEEAKKEIVEINPNSRVPDTQAQKLDKQAVIDRLESQEAQLNREQKEEYHRIDNKMAADIHEEQDRYKLLAVLLPPIPPLLIAICVFFFRRSQERDSVDVSRLR